MILPPPNSDLLDTEARAFYKAARHLAHHGLCAAPRLDEMRRLWTQGRAERALITKITRHWNESFQ